MKTIKVKCPAKINLNLKVKGKRADGFHDIESVMQTISLYDYLDISIEPYNHNEIVLSGMSNEIPYDERNIAYKAAALFIKSAKLENTKIKIFITKNIPVSAGLAGGSTNAAGVLFGLNELYENRFSPQELHQLCATLGSDLNVCLQGGRLLCKGRGEIITPLEFEDFMLSLIKPIKLGISAKEAYTKYSQKIQKKDAIYEKNKFRNDLEWAIIDDYSILKKIKSKYPFAVMTGSGSTFYAIENTFKKDTGFWVMNNLQAISTGITIAK